MTDEANQVASRRADSTQPRAAAVILAAGRSTRMKTNLPKVMHDICGRPMLAFVLDACRDAGITDCYVVVGFGKEIITDAFSREPGIHFVEQREQHGTGHAVSMCADALTGFSGDIVVIAGDMPMIRSATLRELLDNHHLAGAAASIATTVLDDPFGYGRIIRDVDGAFEKIVEHRDCTPEQIEVSEVNPSYYCFGAAALFEALPRIKPDNAKGEFYITDALAIIRGNGKLVSAMTSVPPGDAVGINSQADLADITRLMQRRIQVGWMDCGVTIVDPENTWIDSRSRIGSETIVKPFSYIEGSARIGAGCTVGPYAYVADAAVVADGTVVGPGRLDAFDTTANPRARSNSAGNKDAQVVRKPPAQAGCR
ncbi:MAG: NTP transferase domain-containing protein [Planctomycetota bacterium]